MKLTKLFRQTRHFLCQATLDYAMKGDISEDVLKKMQSNIPSLRLGLLESLKQLNKGKYINPHSFFVTDAGGTIYNDGDGSVVCTSRMLFHSNNENKNVGLIDLVIKPVPVLNLFRDFLGLFGYRSYDYSIEAKFQVKEGGMVAFVMPKAEFTNQDPVQQTIDWLIVLDEYFRTGDFPEGRLQHTHPGSEYEKFFTT